MSSFALFILFSLLTAVRSEYTYDDKLTSDKPVLQAKYGLSVALHGDRLAVGAPHEDGSGRVHVYRHDGTHWRPERILEAAPNQVASRFGHCVGVQGDVVVVCAPGFLHPTSRNQTGAVHVWAVRDGNVWDRRQVFLPYPSRRLAFFGSSLSFHGDRILVGAKGDGADRSGSAAVFRVQLSSWASPWPREARLDDTVRATLSRGNDFGHSSALSGDLAVIGAPGYSSTGAVFLFKRNPTWNEHKLLVPVSTPSTPPYFKFGFSVALQGDLLGISSVSQNDTKGTLTLYHNLRVSPTVLHRRASPLTKDDFGTSLAISEDQRVIVGAPQASMERVGAAFVYWFNGSSWVLNQTLSSPTKLAGSQFGSAVAASARFAVTGAPGDSGYGAVFTWSRSSTVSDVTTTTTSTHGITLATSTTSTPSDNRQPDTSTPTSTSTSTSASTSTSQTITDTSWFIPVTVGLGAVLMCLLCVAVVCFVAVQVRRGKRRHRHVDSRVMTSITRRSASMPRGGGGGSRRASAVQRHSSVPATATRRQSAELRIPVIRNQYDQPRDLLPRNQYDQASAPLSVASYESFSSPL